ncbi:MAG: hypothetical protein ACREDR_45430, partial [Blastocatellia bacterium]
PRAGKHLGTRIGLASLLLFSRNRQTCLQPVRFWAKNRKLVAGDAGMPRGYLTEMSEREHEACRRLVQLPFLSERLFGSLGLQAQFSWFILQMDKERLVPSLRGDVDILAGPLSWSDVRTFESLVSEERAMAQADRHDSWNYQLAAIRLARAGGIHWPPSMSYLLGVEAKSASFLFTLHCGEPENRHLRQEYLAVLETNHNTPYFLKPSPP